MQNSFTPPKATVQIGTLQYPRHNDDRVYRGPAHSQSETVALFYCHDLSPVRDAAHKSMWREGSKAKESHDVDNRLSHLILELMYNKHTKEFVMATHAEAIYLHGNMSSLTRFRQEPVTIADTPIRTSMVAHQIYRDMEKHADMRGVINIVCLENFHRNGNVIRQNLEAATKDAALFRAAYEKLSSTDIGQAALSAAQADTLRASLAETQAQLAQSEQHRALLQTAYVEMKDMRDGAVDEAFKLVDNLRVIRLAAELGYITLAADKSPEVIESSNLPKQLADCTADQHAFMSELFTLLATQRNQDTPELVNTAEDNLLATEPAALAEAQQPEPIAEAPQQVAAPVKEIPKYENPLNSIRQGDTTLKVAVELMEHIHNEEIKAPPQALLKKIDLTDRNQYVVVRSLLNPDSNNPGHAIASADHKMIAKQVLTAAKLIHAYRQNGSLITTGNDMFDTWVSTTNVKLDDARTFTPPDEKVSTSYSETVGRMLDGIAVIPSRVARFFTSAASANEPRGNIRSASQTDSQPTDIQPIRELNRG